MKFGEISIKDKLGRTIILRNARKEDADDLIRYLKVTSGETPYLIREPDEITITKESEEAFIQSNIDSKRALMLIALYEKLGFKTYGTFPDNMKYADGTYVDAWWMMKKL